MKKQSLILSIPQPCDQKWSDMAPSANGRSCDRCNKEIVDFSALSDAQILQHLKAGSGKVCGQFSGKQLHRELTSSTPQQRFSGLSLPALVVVASMSTVNPAYSQTEPVRTAMTADLRAPEPGLTTSAQRVVSGKVLDLTTGEVIPFITVSLFSNGKQLEQTMTDANGAFSIAVAEGTLFDSLYVNGMSSDYEERYFPVSPGHSEKLVLALQWQEPVFMGEIEVKTAKQMRKEARQQKRTN